MAKLRPPKGSLVLVDWVDAHTHDPWTNENDSDLRRALQPQQCQTVGWVLSATPKQLIIAATRGMQTTDNSMDYASKWVIPAGMVQKIEVLEVPQGSPQAKPPVS